MCDDITEAENAARPQARLSRRALNVGAGATVAGLVAGCASSGAGAKPGPVTKKRSVTIETADGRMEGVFVTPATGSAPGVLLWPDVASLRPAYVEMATRLADAGYAVLAVNPYYRSAALPIFETFSEWRTEAGRARIQPMRQALTPEAVTRDAKAVVAWLDAQAEVDQTRKMAAIGYCMGGPFAFRTAAAAPPRVGAIASFHGGGLVTDAPDSPYRLIAEMQAALLICVAQNDDARQPEAKGVLKAAAEAAGRPAEIEVYAANHGWCTIDSPVYDGPAAEQAWSRMLATFSTHL